MPVTAAKSAELFAAKGQQTGDPVAVSNAIAAVISTAAGAPPAK